MAFYVDQLGRNVDVVSNHLKIVSVVPSQTELLFDLGLNEEVAGITKFCVHPQHWFRTKPKIGGTKQLHLNKIRQLEPNLIIANKEENNREQIEELVKEFPVWITDVNNLDGALWMIEAIGKITNRHQHANEILAQIRMNFAQLHIPNIKPRTCYLIWKDPYMTIGGDTFINDMLKCVGLTNIFENQNRYPAVTIQELKAADCELLLLSSEPFPFRQKHLKELQTFLPDTKIVLTDGEMFSWYGSRLIKAPAYFLQLQNQVLSLKHARGRK